MLEELGVHAHQGGGGSSATGFPFVLPLPDGHQVTLQLPEPALLSTLDPSEVGVAILDHLGFARRTWGLARSIPFFSGGTSCLDTEIGAFLEEVFRGKPGCVFASGFRFYASQIEHDDGFEIFVLVTDARAEQRAIREAARSGQTASILRAFGTALTMNLELRELANMAVHSIMETASLAAVLLWVRSEAEGRLELRAQAGVNRHGMAELSTINADGDCTCAAELAVTKGEPLVLRSVYDSLMTTELEAKMCYRKPGGVAIFPLVSSGRLLGVLELLGFHGDASFMENVELFSTLAEQLSLALNGAILYASAERLASFDPLTGIANHRSMQDYLSSRVAEAKRNDLPLGVIMIDVDHFRSFNEEEGHDAGDEVLKRIVDAIKANIREYDLAARYGGEEFTVVLPNVGPERTHEVAERIRRQVEQIEFVTRSGRVRRVSASLGCSSLPQTATEPLDLLKAADEALFAAKRAGRNRTVFYDGAFRGTGSRRQIDFDRLAVWHTDATRAQAEDLLAQTTPTLERLQVALALSGPQTEILKAMMWIYPAYRAALDRGDKRRLRKMEKCGDLRPIYPSLAASAERYDGHGPHRVEGDRIPLLARIASVLLALEYENGEPFTSDPGRFDPEILSLVVDVQEAA